MLADELLHPDHVVPAAELASALVEVGDLGVAHALVEVDAGEGEVLVLGLDVGDAGVHVEDALGLELGFERIVEEVSDAFAMLGAVDVDGGLDGPLVGGSLLEGAGVGIAHDASVFLCHEPRIFLLHFDDAARHLLDGGHVILERDGGLLHVGGIDALHGFGIGSHGWSYVDLVHLSAVNSYL